MKVFWPIGKRFTIRTLLVGIAVLALFLGWIGNRLHRARIQVDAVRELKASGYRLYYDYQTGFPDDPITDVVALRNDMTAFAKRVSEVAERGPPARQWPLSRMPMDSFHTVVWAEIDGGESANTEHVRRLHQLQRLYVSRTRMNTDDWKNIGELRKLRCLWVGWAEIDDIGLQDIDELPRLEELTLAGPSVTDKEIGRLGGMPRLVCLSLRHANVTNDGLGRLLKNLPALKTIDLGRTGITDAGLAHLKLAKRLQFLVLNDLEVDEGLRHFNGLRHLESVDLSFSHVGDAGIAHIRATPTLKWLNLEGTNVTEEGVKALQQSLPDCRIIW